MIEEKQEIKIVNPWVDNIKCECPFCKIFISLPVDYKEGSLAKCPSCKTKFTVGKMQGFFYRNKEGK
jgi:uncharacterized paraquat-inducible protein A